MVIHPRMHVIEQREDGYSGEYGQLFFIVSQGKEEDGLLWLHASTSRKDKSLPTYDDLMTMKRLCIGEHRTALQVFPPALKHVNIAGERGIEVLHLWSCLDRDVTPDFTRGTAGI